MYNAHILIKHTYAHTVICRVRTDNKETEKLHPLEPKKIMNFEHLSFTFHVYIEIKTFPFLAVFIINIKCGTQKEKEDMLKRGNSLHTFMCCSPG